MVHKLVKFKCINICSIVRLYQLFSEVRKMSTRHNIVVFVPDIVLAKVACPFGNWFTGPSSDFNTSYKLQVTSLFQHLRFTKVNNMRKNKEHI